MSLKKCKTISDLFRLALDTNPDGDFVRMVKDDEDVQKITYRSANSMINALSRFLISKGLKKGDKIAVLGSNYPEWAISYFGVVNFGGIVIPVDKMLPIQEILYILRFSDTKCVIGESKYLKDIDEYKEEIPDVELYVSFGIDREHDYITLNQIFKKEFPNIEIEPPDEDDLASLIFTSGTTGLAKGVQLTHKNFTQDVIYVRDWIDINKEDCVYLILPMNHVFAFTCGFLGAISGSAAFTCARSFRPNEILEDIKLTNVTIFLGVPLLFDKILAGLDKKVGEKGIITRSYVKTSFLASKFLKNVFNSRGGSKLFKSLRAKAGLDNVRLFVSGGAPASQITIERYNLMGFKFIQGYGLTETAPVVSLNAKGDYKIGSIGPALKQIEVKIDNPNVNGVGEICVKGDIVMKGYYKNKEATDQVISKDGWFRTGDLGLIDEEGYIFIKGRSKDVIVTSGGKNVYPEEIEFMINISPFIQESLVRGIPDPASSGEVVEAIIVPNYEVFEEYCQNHKLEFCDSLIKDIIKKEIYKVNEKSPVFKRIKDFQIRQEEFEKTSTKKVKRYLYKWKPIEIDQVKEKKPKKENYEKGV
ncbi:MAG TPA: long-chain fatty acid--CoA ligase [Firmicutes bacterium]|nr:long-chain fatty acid--CoA ligase [Bacillota bacterium]